MHIIYQLKILVYTESCLYKVWFVVLKILTIFINVLAIYVAVVACAATVQIRSTKLKLPTAEHILYANKNDGAVCAFDGKCIHEFKSKEDSLW